MNLRIFFTTDVHGYMSSENGGLSRLKTLVDEYDSKTLLLDGGDMLQGSPLVFSHIKKNITGTNPCVKTTNLIGYDYLTIGNHEFNYGQEYLRQAIGESNVPYLNANIDLNGITPYALHEVDGKKILITSVCTHFIPNWENPKHIEGIKIDNAYDSLKNVLESVDADFKIAIYHGGFERDLATGELTEKDAGENQGYRMMKELDFDLFLTGHQHLNVNQKLFGKTVIQTPSNATTAAVIDLEVGDNIKVVDSEIVFLADYEESTAVKENISENLKVMNEFLETEVVSLDEAILIEDMFEARMENHAFARFINKVQMDVSGADFSCASLFGTGFPKDVTVRDVFSNFPYSNTLKVVEVTGAQIKEALEVCASYFEIEDGKVVASRKFTYPKQQHYQYDLYAGFDYTIDLNKELDNRVTCDLEDSKIYTVAMSNYRASGGLFYPMFADAPVVREITDDTAEMMVNYLKRTKIEIPTNNMKLIY